MSDFNILIRAEFFGPAESNDELLVAPILSAFFDLEGTMWFAFEIAEIAGVHCIPEASRFFVTIGTEQDLLAKERSMK